MSTLETNSENLNFCNTELSETSAELNNLQIEIQAHNLKSEIKQQQAGKVEHIRDSDEYKIYSYIVKDWAFPEGVKSQAVKQLSLKTRKGIKITDKDGNEYSYLKKLNKGEKVYIKIPIKEESNETENEAIDKMKCKGGEYFGIDISEKNENIKLTSFKKWNRTKRDSERQDWRGVSFVYIRASDGLKTDKKLTNHLNNIAEYNKDELVIKNNEKIAVGFYHRLNGLDSNKQAMHFIELYKKNKSGGKKLIPMCDVENGGTTGWMSIRNGETESQNKIRIRNHVLTRLKKVENETKIIPGIYINLSNYKKYIKGDKRFNKYKKRIAAYDSNTRDSSFAESGSIDNSGTSPTIYQSRQTGKVDGASNSSGYTDMDRIKDISKILSKNNRSK